jgi:dipeptidyl aminopeptidase/acylaminoacyl peptidase
MRERLKALLFQTFVCLLCAALLAAIATPACAQILTSSDLSRLRSVGSVALSPDGRYIAYAIMMRDLPGRPYDQLWVMDLNTGKSIRLGGDKAAGSPLWSGDSKWIAFHGQDGDKHGLLIAHPDGSSTVFLAALAGTNSPLPGTQGGPLPGRRMGSRLPSSLQKQGREVRRSKR